MADKNSNQIKVSITLNVILAIALFIVSYLCLQKTYNTAAPRNNFLSSSTQGDTSNLFQNDSIKFSGITQREARAKINFWRDGAPDGTMKSFWINSEIINYFVTNPNIIPRLNGLRFYLAQNKPRMGQPSTIGYAVAGDTTLIVVPTFDNGPIMDTIDVVNQYYDYSKPCPPKCVRGDIGN